MSDDRLVDALQDIEGWKRMVTMLRERLARASCRARAARIQRDAAWERVKELEHEVNSLRFEAGRQRAESIPGSHAADLAEMRAQAARADAAEARVKDAEENERESELYLAQSREDALVVPKDRDALAAQVADLQANCKMTDDLFEASQQDVEAANSKIAALREALNDCWDYFGGLPHHVDDCPGDGCEACPIFRRVNVALSNTEAAAREHDERVRAESAPLREVARELADEGCFYGDGCPAFGSNHGVCLHCKAQRALGSEKP